MLVPFAGPLGDVIEQKGNSMIERPGGEELMVDKGTDVESYDTVKTAKGLTAIQFVDDTRVDVTEHSKLLIDEFVYDPNIKIRASVLKQHLAQYAMPINSKESQDRISHLTPSCYYCSLCTDS